MSKRIRIEWPDLGLSATATLADDKNPELCQEFWNALPLESIESNAVVTHGSMYAWVPMLSYAPVRFRERIDEAPIGRLRFSQSTGNKFIIQYGPCNEDLYAPVLGLVDPEHIETIQKVGKEAWDAVFYTKKPIRIRVSREGEDAASDISWVDRLTHRHREGALPAVYNLVDEIYAEAAQVIAAEPEELKGIRLGRNVGIGSYGQYYSTWEFTYSMLRDYSMYTLYPITRLARNEDMDVKQLSHVFREFDPPYTNFVGFCGLRKLQDFAGRFREMMDDPQFTKDDFRHVADALCLYTNMLSSWAYFYYPWGIGIFYRFADEEA